MSDRIRETAEVFALNVAEHQMTVLHEDGLYRHIRFARPGTGMYRFDLVTWPGYLAIAGDMDSYTFTRVTDMFEFFRAASGWNHSRINPGYWAEKVTDGRERAHRYSEDRFAQLVKETFVDVVRNGRAPAGLGKAVREEILDAYDIGWESGAREALEAFEFKGFRFRDIWDWDFSDWDWHYLYACHAIQWGIEQYDRARVVAS